MQQMLAGDVALEPSQHSASMSASDEFATFSDSDSDPDAARARAPPAAEVFARLADEAGDAEPDDYLLYTNAQLIGTRRYRQQLAGDHHDWGKVKAFFARGAWLVNFDATTLPALTGAMLDAIAERGELSDLGRAAAEQALCSIEHGSITGHSALILLAQVPGTRLRHRGPAALAGAHLARPATLISADQKFRTVVVAVAPLGVHERHRLLSLASHIGSVLVDDEFRADMQTFESRDDIAVAFSHFEARSAKETLGLAASAMRTQVATRFGHLAQSTRERGSTLIGGGVEMLRTPRVRRDTLLSSEEERNEFGTPLMKLFKPHVPKNGDDVDHEHQLRFSHRVAGGIFDDLHTRFTRSLYASDWLGIEWKKTLSAVAYMYIATVVPTIAFGGLLGEQTGGQMALSEIMLTQSVVGLFFALLGGNVLAIFRPSGPVVAFIALVYSLAVSLDVDFLVLWAWVCIWLTFWLLLVAVTDLSVLVKYVTEFTEDVFSALISTLFMYTALKHAYNLLRGPINPLSGAHGLHLHNATVAPESAPAAAVAAAAELLPDVPGVETDADNNKQDVAVLSLVLLFMAHALAVYGSNFRTSKYLSKRARSFIHVAGSAIALVVPTVITYLTAGSFHSGGPQGLSHLESLEVPLQSFQPSLLVEDASGRAVPRDWCVRWWDLTADDAPLVGHAFYLGFLLAALFYVEQNISNELMAAPHNKLRKPITFHWDLFVAALLALMCGLLGLPVAHAALPHSVMHLHALAREEYNIVDGRVDRHVLRVEENRWSAFLISALILLTILVLPFLSVIPLAAIYGMFLYMGWSSLTGNPFFLRLKLWITDPHRYPPHHIIRTLKPNKVHAWTAIQLAWLAVIWSVKLNHDIAHFFPLAVLAMLPFRMYVLPFFYDDHEIGLLDGKENTEHKEGSSHHKKA